LALQEEAAQVYVDPSLIEYAVQLVTATRKPQTVGLADLAPYIMFGASPRASINMILAARVMAYLKGRQYALPQDVRELALDVMRHRLVLSYEALSDNISGDELLEQILNRIPIPEVSSYEPARAPARA
jgi:MoxR-like ATPase